MAAVLSFSPVGAKMAAMFYKSLFSNRNGGDSLFLFFETKMAEEHVYFPSVCGGRGPVQTQLSCGH